MKFQLNINGNEVLVSAEQLEAVLQTIEGCEVLDARYLGKGKGFWGPDMDYSVEFKAFDTTQRTGAMRVMTTAAIDKLKTLIEYRKGEA